MQRTTVRLPDSIMRQIKQYAAAQGITITEFLTRSAVSYLNRDKKHDMEDFDLPVSRSRGGLQPGVDIDKAIHLLNEMDDRRKYGKLVIPTFSTGELREGLNLDKTSYLANLGDEERYGDH